MLGRLDVDHVAVKRPDGTTEKVEGSYHVMAVDGVTSIIDGWYPTNTGLDLPPGTYKLIVNYPTSAGTEGRFEETFTTP